MNLDRSIDLFAQIFKEKKTGVLKLVRDKINKELYFRRGWLFFGRSNVANECLGRLLLEGGKISKDDFDKSLACMKSEKRKQGDILIEMGALTTDDMYFALKYQLKQRAVDIMKWEGGSYQFIEAGELDPTITDITRVPLPSIIYEAINFVT